MSCTTTTSPPPSSTASSSAVACFASTALRSGPSTCPKTSYDSMTTTLRQTAEFPEKMPQNFRNAQLGLIANKVWTRGDAPTGVIEGRNGPRKASGSDYASRTVKESDRWGEQIVASAEALPEGYDVVHVADREADIYALFDSLLGQGHRFVIRLSRDKGAGKPERRARMSQRLRPAVAASLGRVRCRARAPAFREQSFVRRGSPGCAPPVLLRRPPRSTRLGTHGALRVLPIHVVHGASQSTQR
jgi:hypothetical protein